MLVLFISVSLGLCVCRWADVYAARLVSGAAADACTLYGALLSIRHNDFHYLRDGGCALAMGLLVFWLIWLRSNQALALFCLVICCLAVLDLKTRLLPDAITYPLLIYTGLFGPLAINDVLVSISVVATLLFSISYGYYAWRGVIGFGGGDIKLLIAIAAWFGHIASLNILLMAALMAIIYYLFISLIQIITNINNLQSKSHISTVKHYHYYAFGPFIAMALIVQILI